MLLFPWTRELKPVVCVKQTVILQHDNTSLHMGNKTLETILDLISALFWHIMQRMVVIPTFWDNLLVPLLRVKKPKKKVGHSLVRCLFRKSQ
jgi:hypothetical protein